MHYLIRATYLIVLAQLARGTGSRHNLDLHPVTNGRGAEQAFTSFFELEPMPSKGRIVSFDLEVVSVDLEGVPLDEILQFRDDNRDAHRKYMQDLRAFAASLNALEPPDRQRALDDRRAELQEEARTLRRLSIEAWKRPTKVGGFGLGLAGAALTLETAAAGTNPLPAALITALGAVLTMLPETRKANAYTYLFKAARGPY
jgi:alkylation response protein AidB-like acyl-CoA dehydrogenase